MNSAKPIGLQPYFYGRITRDESEKILKDRGCQEGLFLLRESTKRMGDYVLSLCAHNKYVYFPVPMLAVTSNALKMKSGDTLFKITPSCLFESHIQTLR